ncbi:MAG: hypothetical protein CFE29_23580 [Bradyrhizobiaceae bacterium PARB1]|jgi:hypothetical protein|nr:MAG: hypothetical protein CFE29_23580 [Bradyrhizobiaceae bacterium PARB1]
MQKRDRKIRRIAAVQARLHRIAEWHLMECQARENELEDKQRRILEAFNDESKLPDLLIQTAGQNLRTASVEQGAVAKVRERLAENARAEGRKLKHVEHLVHLATGRAAKDDEKRMLDDEIDKAVRRSLQTT